jgi:hypothetical protein
MRCRSANLCLTIAWLVAGTFPARGVLATVDGTPVETSRLPPGGICPRVAVEAAGRVHLVYFKGDPQHGDLFCSTSDDGGRTFADASRVNGQRGTVVVVGSVRGPQVALGKGGRVHVTWTGPVGAGGRGLAMWYARSAADGSGFEPQRNVTVEHPGVDGGGSVAADPDGNVYVAWHAMADGGSTDAERQVWVARSSDDGATFGASMLASPADTGACGCCGLQVAAGAGGRVYVLFRAAAQHVHRDTYLMASGNYGSTFTIVATDPWQANACVMSTSALAVSDRTSLAAWETRGQIFRRPLDGAGGTTVARVSGRGNVSKHPAVAINGRGESVVAWAEGTGWARGGSVAWQAFAADGRPIGGESGRADGLPSWDAPAVFATPDGRFHIVY